VVLGETERHRCPSVFLVASFVFSSAFQWPLQRGAFMFVPGGRGGRKGFLWNAVVVVVWWRRCAGGEFLFSSGRGF
jgi:hypothetical protein